jgi:hypothetical protein
MARKNEGWSLDSIESIARRVYDEERHKRITKFLDAFVIVVLGGLLLAFIFAIGYCTGAGGC